MNDLIPVMVDENNELTPIGFALITTGGLCLAEQFLDFIINYIREETIENK